MVHADLQAIAERMASVKNKLLVLSGKGGVGKSTFATQLAFALAAQGKEVRPCMHASTQQGCQEYVVSTGQQPKQQLSKMQYRAWGTAAWHIISALPSAYHWEAFEIIFHCLTQGRLANSSSSIFGLLLLLLLLAPGWSS
jgi:hypothetical protein